MWYGAEGKGQGLDGEEEEQGLGASGKRRVRMQRSHQYCFSLLGKQS